jgi:hypothetical protein
VTKKFFQKLVATSLTFDNLKLACDRDGFDGLHALLSEKDICTGKPRVTKCHRVVQKLVDHFSK